MSFDDDALRLVFDLDALGSLTGAARAGHLRYKPGSGLTAALLDDDGSPTGWLRIVADGRDKLANAQRRAQRRGLAVDHAALPHGLALWGPIMADPGLARALRDVPAALAARWEVLRYNPLRRLVVAVPDKNTAGRLTHSRQDHLRDAAAHVSARVPAVARVTRPGLPTTSRITWWGWCDGGDLAAHPSAPGAREAGRVAALLHRASPPPGSDVRAQAAAQVQANVALLGALDPHLAARWGTLAEGLAPLLATGDAAVTSHGDLSADQFFLDGSRVLLGDLDRVTAGPRAFALGSFAATSAHLLGDFLEGYGAPDAELRHLDAWTGFAHAIRITEPFRAAAPGWRDQVAARLTTIEETLCNRS